MEPYSNNTIPVKNYKTNETGHLTLCISVDISDDNLIRSVQQIFNSEAMFAMFVRSGRKDRFSAANVKSYLKWSFDQTTNKTNITYFIFDENSEISAGLDIQKASDDTATIGFWADPQKPGWVTNGVKKLIPIIRSLGYQDVDAYPETNNLKSIGVLDRLGFERREIVQKATKKLQKFYFTLSE